MGERGVILPPLKGSGRFINRHFVLPRAYKRREGMQLGKHQNSHVGGRMCMNAHVIVNKM